MQLLFFVLAGIVFGLANIIPGVSGGTMAVVFGIYERLLSVLSDPLHNIKKEWKFLVTFGIGLAIGILAFGKLMNWALENYPAQAAMFFIGVILGSIPMLFKSSFMPEGKVKLNAANIIAFLVGFAIMIPMILAGNTDEAKAAATAAATAAEVSIGNILLMVVYGIIASSTMIIPGISGSFVMLLMGVYGTLIASVANLFPFTAATPAAVIVLLPFGIGVVIGLMFCSKLIKFLLAKFPVPTYAAIFGFVLGSIGCVFPGFDQIDLIGIIAAVAGILVLWGCERLTPGESK